MVCFPRPPKTHLSSTPSGECFFYPPNSTFSRLPFWGIFLSHPLQTRTYVLFLAWQSVSFATPACQPPIFRRSTLAADSDPIPNSDSALGSSEASALSPDNPASQFAELPSPSLSGGLSLSKAEVASRAKLRGEEPLPGESQQSSSKRFSLNESDEASRAEMHPVRSFGAKTESRSCGSLSPVYP